MIPFWLNIRLQYNTASTLMHLKQKAGNSEWEQGQRPDPANRYWVQGQYCCMYRDLFHYRWLQIPFHQEINFFCESLHPILTCKIKNRFFLSDRSSFCCNHNHPIGTS